MLNWKYNSEFDCMMAFSHKRTFQIIKVDGCYGAYVDDTTAINSFGYLNGAGHIKYGPGLVSAAGLPPECQFPNEQSVRDVCEKYLEKNK